MHAYMQAYMTYAKSLQSCPTLCDPVDSSPPGSSVHRILQARILVGVIYLHPLQWKPKIYFTRTLSYVTLAKRYSYFLLYHKI